MAIPTLFGSYIDETYERLVQVSGSEFADGLGNPITFGTIDTGSLLQASVFNQFTASYNTGSFTGSFTGTLSGNASSADYATSAGNASTADNINGYSNATVDQINVGEPNAGTYTYIVRSEELEQSKHSTINIFNFLNFT